jgi:transcriptional regulator of acetoin/glycerol metabolism
MQRLDGEIAAVVGGNARAVDVNVAAGHHRDIAAIGAENAARVFVVAGEIG